MYPHNILNLLKGGIPMVLIGILIGVVMALFMATLVNYYNGGRLLFVVGTDKRRGLRLNGFRNVKTEGWICSLVVGGVTFLAFCNTKVWKQPWIAIIVCIAMVIIQGLLLWWPHGSTSVIKEIIVSAVIFLEMYFLFRGNTYIVSILWDNKFLTRFVTLVPLIVLIGAIGFTVSDAFFYLRDCKEDMEPKDAEDAAAAERHNVFGWAVRVLAVIVALVVIITTFTACGDSESKDADSKKTWYYFYNTELQGDKDETNNFDFGPNPYHKSWTAKDYDADFRETLKNDPAIASACIAWFDANLGTRYLGEFYESCKHDWAKTINAAKQYWMDHKDEYYQTLDAFFAFLDTGTVKLTEADDLDDQMYMNPYTPDKVPDVIVMETLDHEGLFLTYTFKIKGSSKTTDGKPIAVSYRIECRYQPTNVAEVMNITPQKITPEPTSSPDPPSPTNSPSPPGPTEPATQKPTEPPTEPATYNKDKSKGTKGDVVGPNDDPGPGPDTNNGVGATESTKDQPENSNHLDSYDDYLKKMDELEDINNTQKVGGDSNKPSTKPSPGTTVDSNADNGTGNGGVDTPTPTSVPAKTSDGNPISNTPDNPAGAWGGPPD